MSIEMTSQRVNLRDLLPEAHFVGEQNIQVSRCTTDPAQFSAESALVLLPGSEPSDQLLTGRFTPHAHHQKQGGIIISSQPIPGCRTPVCVVHNPLHAYGRICHALADNPTTKLKLVGVLGTRSRTGVASLLAGILRMAGQTFGLLGATGCMDSAELLPRQEYGRSVGGMVRWLQQCVQQQCTHAILEISPSMLAAGWAAGCQFDVLCVGDGVGTRGERGNEELEYLFQHQIAPRGFAVFNADSPAAVQILERVTAPALTIGVQRSADVTAKPLGQNAAEQTLLLIAGNDVVPMRTHRIGHRVVSDSLMATAVGLGWNLELPMVVRGIESIESIPGHCERVVCGQPFSVYVESRRSLSALRETLATLRGTKPRRLICVVNAETELSPNQQIQWTKTLSDYADQIVLTSSRWSPSEGLRLSQMLPRIRIQQAELEQRLTSMRRSFPNPQQVQTHPQRGSAMAHLFRKAVQGDLIVLVGGRKAYDGDMPVDDAEIARRLLYDH